MKRYPSQFGVVELTDERWRHIIQFHPEVAKHTGKIALVLKEPEHIAISKSDSSVIIFSRSVGRMLKLAVVVKLKKPNFVLTAYITTKANKQ